ncbi:hypothetical protein THAOC_16910, partial [Thalassiosira oceanica]
MCVVFGLVDESWVSSRVVGGAEAGQELGLNAAISPDGSSVLCHGKGVLSVSGDDWVADDIVSSLGDESFGTFKAISYSALSDEGQLVVGTSSYDTFKGTYEIFNRVVDEDTTNAELISNPSSNSSAMIGINDTYVDMNLGTVLFNSTNTSTPTPEEQVEGDMTILDKVAGKDEILQSHSNSTMLVYGNETNSNSSDEGFDEDGNFTQSLEADLGTTANGTDSLINGTSSPSQAPSLVATLPFGVNLAPTSDVNSTLVPTIYQDNITLAPNSAPALYNTSFAPSPSSSMSNMTATPSSSTTSDLTVDETDETPSPQLPVVFESIQTFAGDYRGAYAGSSVSMSSSGDFVAVGFRGGISPGGDRVGMVSVYRRDDDGKYSQYGVDGMFGNSSNAEFGSSVSISEDGQRVAVGARSSSTADKSKSGAVQVFEYNESTDSFIQIGRTLYGPAERDRFGWAVSMDAGGLRVAASSPRGYGGTGFAQVYEYDGSDWIEYGDAVTGAFASRFGFSLSLSQDGGTLAVGAFTATDDEEVPNKGSVSIYSIEDSSLSPVQVLYGSGENAQFGYSVALSGNGQRLVVGAKGYGIEGVDNMGMCGVFGLVDESWVSSRVVGGAEAGQELGLNAAISPDGSTVLCHGKGVLSVSGDDWVADDIVSSLGDESFGTFKAISYSALSDEGQLVVGTSSYDTFKGTFEIFNRVVDEDTTNAELISNPSSNSSGSAMIGINDTYVDMNLGTVLFNSTNTSTPTPEEQVE